MMGQIPREAGWDTAPDLLEGATNLTLTAKECNLRYWLGAVSMGTLRGRISGHAPDALIPDYMREPGPLYDAITQEYAFRSMAEDKAARGLAYLVPVAPDADSMEFYVTQVLDEARHAIVFRDHLVELGVDADELPAAMERFAGADRKAVLDPLEDFAMRVMREERDFLGGVVMITIIIEGALAPAAELSERKWRVLNPAAAEIDKGAGIDEIRHLTVGASIARQWLIDHPEDKPRVLSLIREGMRLWEELPVVEILQRREQLFQVGLEQHADVVGDYEIWPGRRLIDTTPDERQLTAHQWSEDMKASRLRYMGLEEALA